MADESGATAPTIDSPSPPSTKIVQAARTDPSVSPEEQAGDYPGAATEIQASIEAEDDDDEGLGSDALTNSSTSISSSIRNHTFENNRRYHRFQEGRYHFPNDEPEQEREDMKHAMIINLMDSRLHLAPLQNPQAVLDIGTGTGIWAIDSTNFPVLLDR
jgi:hypothetical protein